MAALIDDEGAAEFVGGKFVGAERIIKSISPFCALSTMPATSRPPLPGRKPRSSAATRDAAVCSTLNPFQPPSAKVPAGPIMPVSMAIFAASRRIAAPSERATAAGPRISIGRLAFFRTAANGWLPSASASSTFAFTPSCSTG